MKRTVLSLSILKSNRLFSAALLLIYTLAMSLMVMLCFFSESIDATFQSFLDEYGLPDAYIVTSGSEAALSDSMKSVDGVEEICAGAVTDMPTGLPSGDNVTLRYIGLSDNDRLCMYNVDTGKAVNPNENTVAVSSAFARSNSVRPGDTLTVSGKNITVTDIVSTPETIAVGRDSSSWYDTADFAYIYVSEQLMSEIIGVKGYANQFRVYFAAGVDEDSVLESLEETPGLNVVSSQLFEGSLVDRQIKAGIDGTKAVVTYLPGFIAIIGVLFSTLFMGQIIKNSRKKIALLRTLGYSCSDAAGIFIIYSLILTLTSSLLGGGLGVFLLEQMLNIYKSVYDLPFTAVRGSGRMLAVIFAALQLIGVVSCLLCSSGISSADPAAVMSRSADVDTRPLPGFFGKTHINSFSKIALTSMYRNRKRLMISVLCSIACLCLNHLSIGILISKDVGLNTLFTDRLRGDVTAFCSTDEALDKICALPCVETAEKKVSFSVEYDGEVMRIETLDSTDTLTHVIDTDYQIVIPEGSGIAVEEGFARRHNISVGDIITVADVEIEVICLTREYLYPVMYISFSQAEQFGYTQFNAAEISLADGFTVSDFSNEAAEISGYLYLTDTESRESSARETLNQLDLPCVLFIVFAMVIGLVIISNMNLISIKERSREYATLSVLGTEKFRFLKMTAAEAGAQYVLTCIIGVPLSVFVSGSMLTAISSISQEYVPEKTATVSLIACLLTLLYIILGVLLTQGYIRKMNVLSVLNEKE